MNSRVEDVEFEIDTGVVSNKLKRVLPDMFTIPIRRSELQSSIYNTGYQPYEREPADVPIINNREAASVRLVPKQVAY